MPDIQYKKIIDTIGHWVWEVDASGRYTYCSDNVVDYLGYTHTEVIGKTPFDFMSSDEAQRVTEIFNNIVKNKSPIIDLENTHTNKNNQNVIVVSNGIPLFDNDNNIIGYQGFDRDITQQKMLEHRVKENELLLIQQSRLATMGEMIANISHQWKQPLNSLALVIQKMELLFKKDLLTEKLFHEEVTKCMSLIENMTETIHAFKDFFNSSKEKKHFLVSDALNNAFSIVEPEFKLHLIDFHIEFSNELSNVLGCKNEFAQVLLNLFNNAKDEILQKQIQNPYIKIVVDESSDNKTLIHVSDNAGGIPEESLEKIFDPYFSTKKHKDGTGIGLYMSKMIIEETFNGTLKASNNDEGACFTIAI